MAAEQPQRHEAQKHHRPLHRHARLVCFVLLIVGAAPLAHAAIDAAAKGKSSVISQTELNTLRAEPLSLLAQFPEGGALMARYVAQAVAAEPRVVPPILSIAPDASPEQSTAIGAGLVRGTRALAAKQPKVARDIANQVMQSSNTRLKMTFRALGPYSTPNGELAFTMPVLRVLSPLTLTPAVDDNAAPLASESVVPIVRNDYPKTYNNDIQKERDALIDDMDGRLTAYVAIAADAPSSGVASTSPTE